VRFTRSASAFIGLAFSWRNDTGLKRYPVQWRGDMNRAALAISVAVVACPVLGASASAQEGRVAGFQKTSSTAGGVWNLRDYRTDSPYDPARRSTIIGAAISHE
jgi:hypothetical protein